MAQLILHTLRSLIWMRWLATCVENIRRDWGWWLDNFPSAQEWPFVDDCIFCPCSNWFESRSRLIGKWNHHLPALASNIHQHMICIYQASIYRYSYVHALDRYIHMRIGLERFGWDGNCTMTWWSWSRPNAFSKAKCSTTSARNQNMLIVVNNGCHIYLSHDCSLTFFRLKFARSEHFLPKICWQTSSSKLSSRQWDEGARPARMLWWWTSGYQMQLLTHPWSH